jgi:hypothetical protein
MLCIAWKTVVPARGTAAAMGAGMSFEAWMKFGMVSVLCTTLAGCGAVADVADAVIDSVDGTEERLESATTPAGEQMCQQAIKSFVKNKDRFSHCDFALVADCTNVLGVLQDNYVNAIAECLSDDQYPAVCFFEATLALQPTEAHHDLVSSYCDQCLFGVDGCEEVFYFGDQGQLGLGMVALPFSDDVVRQIEDECTTDLTCSVDLPGCTQEILLDRLIPQDTLACLLNPLQ